MDARSKRQVKIDSKEGIGEPGGLPARRDATRRREALKGAALSRHWDSNRARPLLNERPLGYEIVCVRARLCIRVYIVQRTRTYVRMDECLLGTKGSQLPSYVRCHVHHRLYNPSCDVRLFNPFITELALLVSVSPFNTRAYRKGRNAGKTAARPWGKPPGFQLSVVQRETVNISNCLLVSLPKTEVHSCILDEATAGSAARSNKRTVQITPFPLDSQRCSVQLAQLAQLGQRGVFTRAVLCWRAFRVLDNQQRDPTRSNRANSLRPCV